MSRVESGAFIDTAGSGRPDVQIHVTPALVGDAERKPMGRHGITINPCVLRPSSRGKVSLRSADPSDSVMLQPNNLTTREDVDTLVRGIKACRQILRSDALRSLGFTVDVVDQERCTVSFSHSSPYLSLSSGEHTFYKNFEAIGAFEVVN